MKLTQEEVHDVEQQYNVKLVDNIPTKRTQRVTWLCTMHDKPFTATVWDVVNNKKRCSECARLKRLASRRASVDEYRRVAADHNLTFVENTVTSPETWRCNTCGAEFQDYFCHVKRSHRHGCPTCSQRHVHHEKRHTIDEYVNMGKQHGFVYLDTNVRPDNIKTLVRWQCSACQNEILMSYTSIRDGRLCPKCCCGAEEYVCRDILENLLGIKFQRMRPNWLLSDKGYPLELDIYSPKHELAFEYQGPQHFQYLPFFHNGVEDFNKRQKLDALKVQQCTEHGTKLVTIANFNHAHVGTCLADRVQYIKQLLSKNDVFQWLTARGWTAPTSQTVTLTSPTPKNHDTSLCTFHHRPAVTPLVNVSSHTAVLPQDVKVLTDHGYIDTNALVAGTKVFTEDGTLTVVQDVQSIDKQPVYRVSFTDKTFAFCGEQHVWKVIDRHYVHLNKASLLTTLELSHRKLIGSRNASNYTIPVCKPIKYSNRPTTLPAYTLGALLGDGNLLEQELFLNNHEQDVLARVNHDVLQYGAFEVHPTSNHSDVQFVNTNSKHFLWDIVQANTHGDRVVPEKYMYFNPSSRRWLLRGIVDTVGQVTKKGIIKICVSNERFATSICQLVRSLGYRPKNSSITREKNGKQYTEYQILFLANYEQMFASNRNMAAYKQREIAKKAANSHLLGITSVHCLDVVKPMIKITTAGDAHTIIVDNYIVTGV